MKTLAMKNMLLKFIKEKFNYSLLFFLILISSLDGNAQTVTFTANISWPAWSGENIFRIVGPATTGYICDPSRCYNGNSGSYSATAIFVGTMTASCATNAYSIEMLDYSSDGWDNSGTITLFANGVSVGTFACAGGSTNTSFTLPATVVTSGCNIGLESGPNFVAASGCSNGSLNLGPGAYYDITLAANTYYNFSWAENSGATTSGFCATITPAGSGATSNSFSTAQTNWYSGSVARTLRVSANRLCSVWSGTSATLTYRHSAPTATTVSGGGTFCSSSVPTTLTASGGTYGTMYWQNTTSGGTSTATASSSQGVSSAGTYYFISNNNGCWGAEGSATISLTSPTANAGGALAAICQGAQSAAMGGSVGGSATGGTWSGGAGSWTNATNPSTARYTAAAGEGGSITLTLTTSGGSCGTTTATKNLTLPTVGTNISGSSSATCVVKDNNWIHFYNGSGLLIGAINSGGVDLGNVTMNVSVGGAGTMDACNETPVNPLYTTAYMGRAWVVTSSAYPGTNFPSSATVRLPFDGSELTDMNTTASTITTDNPNDNGANVGNLMLTKFTGASEDFSPTNNCAGGVTRGVALAGSGTVTTTYPLLTGATGASYVEFSVGQFSEMFLNKNFNASPLPVKLIDFKASCAGNEVHLNWSTASEQNSMDFVVERSRDLNEWQEVEIILASGTTNTPRDYFSIDSDALSGTSYYRLRQRDLNGAEEIFGPIAVECENENNSIKVYPNPTKGNFTVELTSLTTENGVGIQLTDLTGKVIESKNIDLESGTNQIYFNNQLESGIYLIRVLDQKSSFKTLKLEINTA